ncbi:non-ribosomal peptide synthetase [Actinophytocola oryzae]|uniref:Non-ribosomal peptide synthase protein (TIGR01720 family)/amino acid adenylation domain-containing protein n=1 Tax=Actinophytocola oryzae TaxID=502181 RepID=A0A4R7VL25_9PSEU|nr:non-ribosomal peptide synthetase [Actinophytocola oryzae]TDV49928.1 non-ribosomal peptide synthase protein (TIGR01720 family)/amino acid adenylation domain-containing protein [Actinophytocola oryzae]
MNDAQSLLLSRIRGRRNDHLPRRDPFLPVPLSSAQRGLWFLDRLEPGRGDYVVPIALRVTGDLDVPALRHALTRLVARHEVLRTRFVADDTGRPCQVVDPPAPVTVAVEDVPEAEVRARVDAIAAEPFDLAAGPLLRAVLVRADTDTLVLCLHHIVFDGWSESVLARELGALYAGEGLPELPVQYGDYAAWHDEQLGTDRMRGQLEYWRTRLAGLAPLQLPADRQCQAAGVTGGDAVRFTVPAATVTALRAAAATVDANLFMAVLGAYQVLLSRYSGQTDLAVGTPAAGRNRTETENLIGLFVNSLVLRTDLSGDPSYAELLTRVQETALAAYDNQELPFERIVEELAPRRDVGRNPFFQTTFVLQTAGETQPWQLPGVTVERTPVSGGLGKFDLNMTLRETAEGALTGYVDYPVALFERATVERLVGHFRTLLAQLAERPAAPLSEVSLLGEDERFRMVVEWNRTEGPFPSGRTIHGLLAEQTAARLDEPAVRYGDEVLTNASLDARACRLAHCLRERGVGPDVMVGVFLDRTPDLVVTLLAIMKAGGAWVPMDPEYPADRLAYLMADTAAPLVITQTSLTDRLPEHINRLVVDQEWPAIAQYPAHEPEPLSGPHDLAYVIYTSGSTGKPKGVMIEHEGVVNYLHWCARNYPPAGEAGTLLYSPVAFDLTVTALFLPLLQGLPIDIPVPQDGESAFSAAVEVLLSGASVSFLKMTPSHAELLVTSAEAADVTLNVGTMVLGGEELTADLARRILAVCQPDCAIFNEYGATECSVANVMSETRHVDADMTGPVSVGGPITNTTAYIVDAHNRPVPIGVAGEALLGGICVARGYLNREELTATRFVELDLGDGPQRLYRTGDLCKWLPSGEMEFIGRIDNQVKLRGYRIELGEIEATFIDHPAISGAAVVVREDTPGVKRLVAYLVGTDIPSPDDLKAHAARTLPAYMLPNAFVTLDTLPLTPNGKVDRAVLPAPAVEAADHTPPRTPAEHLVAGIWRDVLGVTEPGVHDDFFDHGGHSLLAIKLTTRLGRELGVDVPLRVVFQAPTIAELSDLLPRLHAATEDTIPPAPRHPLVPLPLSPAQRALWFLDQLEPGRSDYVVPIALRITGDLDVVALETALTRLVARHEVLRTRFAADDTGRPFQVVDQPSTVDVTVVDVDEEHAPARIAAAAAASFDLTEGPLLRTVLVRTGPGAATLVLCLHHILFDGWSEAILARELRHHYAAATGGTVGTLPELPVQYADYAAWQHDRLATDALRAQLDFWRGELSGVAPLRLPTDRPRLANRSPRGDVVGFTVPAATVTALREIATGSRASLFMALLAGFQVMLSRYSGQDDIAVGTPIAGRGQAETENLIGFFVNSLVLRTDLSGDPTYAELLDRVRDTALAAYDHQELPFERIVEELAPRREVARNPLFQAMLVLRTSGEAQAWELPGVDVTPVPVDGGLGKFDLNLTLHETDDGGLTAQLDYPADLFDRATVERMGTHFATLLGHLVTDPAAPLSAIPMLTAAEQETLTAWEVAAGARVLDAAGRPVPVGVPGELVRDGARTGDLVTWSPAGEPRFVCRVEHVVTVHGERVGLSDVDAALAAHPAVTAAATAVHDGELAGYVTGTPDIDDLRRFLGDRLPAVMVPSAFVTLPDLPRTSTGTVDRAALPAPTAEPTHAEPPHSATEKVIADIWRELLDVPEVLVTDNFFALGGDSIISLQVIARARKFGIQLTPRMFFQHQTVAAIAANARSTGSVLADQTKIVGDVPLTPIQHWFFALGMAEPAHFNQVELLETDGLDGEVLARALAALADHHDALRLRVVRGDDGRWRQHLAEDPGPAVLTCHDLSGLAEDAVWPEMKRIADDTQRGMNLLDGPVIRAALFDLGGHGQRLLIGVHHLAVDGVSWRILLEDLGTAYGQAARGRSVLLPAKTTSVRTWAEKLVRYARSPGALAELGYWTAQAAGRPLPRDHDGANTERSAATVRVELTEDETTALLRDVPRAFHTQINDALLTAVGTAVHAWTGDDAVAIGLEGHGREDLFPDVDTSRTVGWFTSVFPVALTGLAEDDPAIRLKDVSEQLRAIPHRGIGYGVLRYLGDTPTRHALTHPAPEVNVNYLGQLGADVPGIGRHAAAGEPRGRSFSDAGTRRHLLDILSAVERGRLGIDISYSTEIHDQATVSRFADHITGSLRALLDIVTQRNDGAGTAQVPLAELEADELAAIMRRFGA